MDLMRVLEAEKRGNQLGEGTQKNTKDTSMDKNRLDGSSQGIDLKTRKAKDETRAKGSEEQGGSANGLGLEVQDGHEESSANGKEEDNGVGGNGSVASHFSEEPVSLGDERNLIGKLKKKARAQNDKKEGRNDDISVRNFHLEKQVC